MVEATQYKSRTRSSATPIDNEGKKMYNLGNKLYDFAALLIKIANCQATMGAYQKHLWDKIILMLHTLPNPSKTEALNVYEEANSLTRQ